MKKLLTYEVRFDLSKLTFQKTLITYEVIKETKSSYHVVDINDDYSQYRNVGIIMKPCPYIEYNYSYVQEDKIDNEYTFYSGLLYEDGDKDLSYKMRRLIEVVDDYYKDIIDEFFKKVHEMEQEYSKIYTLCS